MTGKLKSIGPGAVVTAAFIGPGAVVLIAAGLGLRLIVNALN